MKNNIIWINNKHIWIIIIQCIICGAKISYKNMRISFNKGLWVNFIFHIMLTNYLLRDVLSTCLPSPYWILSWKKTAAESSIFPSWSPSNAELDELGIKPGWISNIKLQLPSWGKWNPRIVITLWCYQEGLRPQNNWGSQPVFPIEYSLGWCCASPLRSPERKVLSPWLSQKCPGGVGYLDTKGAIK